MRKRETRSRISNRKRQDDGAGETRRDDEREKEEKREGLVLFNGLIPHSSKYWLSLPLFRAFPLPCPRHPTTDGDRKSVV